MADESNDKTQETDSTPTPPVAESAKEEVTAEHVAEPTPESDAAEATLENPTAVEEELEPGTVAQAAVLQPGMTIRVYQKMKEGDRERTQIFQGIILSIRGADPASKTMTVAKQSFGVRVEKIFPLASPLIEKIEVVKVAKVRRAKLYFLAHYAKRLKETVIQ